MATTWSGRLQYYFREGFRRGYEDGYNDQYQYGYYSNGSYGVLGNILSLILNLQSLRKSFAVLDRARP